MPDQRRIKRRKYCGQRQHQSVALATIAFFIFFTTSCHSRLFRSAQERFDQATSAYLHGHLGAAEEEAEAGYQKFQSRDIEWAWKFRLLTADILVRRGFSGRAIDLLKDEIPSALHDPNLPIKRQILQGVALTRLGELSEASSHLTAVEGLCTPGSELEFDFLTARGVLELGKSQPERAEPLFRESLTIARKKANKFQEAAALSNLGVAIVRQGRYDESIDWWNIALPLSRQIDSELDEEKVLGNLAWAYYRTGDFPKARQFYEDAGKRAHELGIVIDETRWLYNLGGVYHEDNDLTTAEKYYRQSLALAEQLANPEQITNAWTTLSFVMILQNRLDLAADYSQKAFDLAQAHSDRATELYSVFTKGQIAARGGNSALAEKLFLEVDQDTKSDASIRWQAQDELARLYEQQDRYKLANDQYNRALSTLECARNALHNEEFRLPFLANATRVYDDYIHFLVSRGQIAEAVQAADRNRAQTLAEGLGLLGEEKNCAFTEPPTELNNRRIAQKAGGPVLFYWLGRTQSYLWTVTSRGTEIVKLPPAVEIEAVIQRYRKALLGPQDVSETNNADGIALYKTLVEPAQRFLPAGSHAVVVPDRSLNNLNFETLLVPGTKAHFWIEDITVSYASSLKMIELRETSTLANGRKMLLIGDPVVPDPKYSRLPEAAAEMDRIEADFPVQSIQVYRREKATPATYIDSKPEQYSYIHFVAHGTANQFSPLDSAIVLSKATAEEDSFKLHARDIIAHPLRADLVTISACYGSGSTIYDGEGLVGLSWGFIRAGAHNVIGALWAVSDKSTSQLMAQVYSELSKGKKPEDALRDAKLSLLHSDTIYRKPTYWAPFQLYNGS